MKKEYDFSRAKRGPIVKPGTGKTRITIRLDDDIIQWFRDEVDGHGGGSYQSLINAALRQYVAARPESLEDVVRRVVREELSRQTS